MASPQRRSLYRNTSAKSWRAPAAASPELIIAFHQKLPDYAPTRLVSLDAIANSIGVKAVYLKDESQRLGLPSFKILGASWGTFRALTSKLGLPLTADLGGLQHALSTRPVTLFAATDGNHGRAVARMGAILGVPVEIFVPSGMHERTVQLIKDEGAGVTEVNGSYDDAVEAAFVQSLASEDRILVQDTAFPGYEDIPEWIVDGYRTMLREVDAQLGNETPDLVICPVGVGSFAQAVVSHFKSFEKAPAVLTVEPDTAACLYKSLQVGEPVSLRHTVPTIMAGLDCGTVTSTGWPIHKAGVDASTTVSDYEAHEACKQLLTHGVAAGPCGAAPLAALQRLTRSDLADLGLDENSTLVLFCTEGQRDYEVPRSVSPDAVTPLLQTLVQINSSVPGSGKVRGPGEREIARYVSSWMEHRDIETHWLEATPGRPSVIGVVGGTGGGKNLMLNGHIDAVTIASYEGDALSGKIEDGKLYGRGSADMKSGIAAILVALAQAKKEPLMGDVIFTAVSDEEDMSIGTEEVLAAGWRADAAIVCEPSLEELVIGHKGFVWFDVTIHGVAAHGSRYDLGVDAISRAGYFLVELDKYAGSLLNGPSHPTLGTGSVHASIISGGEEPASYPASCTITVERRTVAGETVEQVQREIESLVRSATEQVPSVSYDVRVTFARSAFSIPESHPFVKLVAEQVKRVKGTDAKLGTVAFWADSALLADSGIPVVMYGPHGEGLHAKEEWVDLESVQRVADTLIEVLRAFCGQNTP